MLKHHSPFFIFLFLVLTVVFAQEGDIAQEGDVAAARSAAAQTLLESISLLRSTYTAEIEFDVPDLAELEKKPSVSFKQRVFEDGTGDIQADLEHIPLPEDAPAGLGDISAGFLYTSEGMAIRVNNDAVMRDGKKEEGDDPFAQFLNSLNEIPIPSDEELAAIDLRQDTEVIDGVECQVLSWIPEEYNADNPKSVAMHCVTFGLEDHLIRSYTALDGDGNPLFSLNFTNINTNPSFGPEDFTFGPDVRVVHVNSDKEFEIELNKLMMKNIIRSSLTPKSKRQRRHTSGNAPSVTPPSEEPPPIASEPPPKEIPPPAEIPVEVKPTHHTLFFIAIGILLVLVTVVVMRHIQKK